MKIFCIGRNYSEHAKELNNDIPDSPVLFMKPPTAILKGKDFFIPEFSTDIHYECELIYRIGKNGKHINLQFAYKYINGVTVGIDFTARDIQADQKKKGLPWEIAKAFDNSAVIGEFESIEQQVTIPARLFNMKKNGETVQLGNSDEMIFSIEQLIVYISQYFTLQQGDIIFTGTPAGVGRVTTGDVLEGYLGTEKKFMVNIK